MSRILFTIKEFRQGWGGAPESIRLMARQLAPFGYSSDVFTGRRMFREIENRLVLPLAGASGEPADLREIADYSAILQTGPFQSFVDMVRLLRSSRAGPPHLYLPRGGLTVAEFMGRRNLKKQIYWPIFESHFLRRANGIVYSSVSELAHSPRARRACAVSHVIPDFVEPLPTPAEPERGCRKVTFGFLAEIRPLKGLVPLMRGFASWARSNNLAGDVRLVVRGGVRPGSERYLAEAHAMKEAEADLDISIGGPLPHDERPLFYGGIDVFVIPSAFESFGLTAVEALSGGCRLLTTPSLGVLEQFEEGEDIVVVPTRDPKQLAGGLQRSYELVTRSVDDREDRRRRTVSVIDRINAVARERWCSVLPR